MSNYRDLEHKHLKEIEWHLKIIYPDINSMLELSSNKEDSNLSFDAKFHDKKISIRIRNNEYLKYPDLTIRSKSKNNGKTEIDKIKEGMAEIYFYGYLDKDRNRLVKIRVVSVDAIRRLIQKKKYELKKNSDGTEFFTFLFSDIKKAGGNIYKYDECDDF